LRDRVISASVYPLVLTTVGALVIFFLLGYVVPRFSKVYQDIGEAHLPLLSRLLMHWGQTADDHAFLFGASFISVIAALGYAMIRPGTHSALERFLWRLPTIGEQLRIYQLARFTRTVAMLLKGGIPLSSALEMTGELLRQPSLQSGLDAACNNIREGHSASSAFGTHNLATDVGIRLLIVGERSGDLGEAMERIASFYDNEIARSVEWFSRLFEPALMLIIGLMIGGIVILMYLPIFELASSIQ
jgi:general secretion pathway protein F